MSDSIPISQTLGWGAYFLSAAVGLYGYIRLRRQGRILLALLYVFIIGILSHLFLFGVVLGLLPSADCGSLAEVLPRALCKLYRLIGALLWYT